MCSYAREKYMSCHTECGGLDENDPHRLTRLNTWNSGERLGRESSVVRKKPCLDFSGKLISSIGASNGYPVSGERAMSDAWLLFSRGETPASEMASSCLLCQRHLLWYLWQVSLIDRSTFPCRTWIWLRKVCSAVPLEAMSNKWEQTQIWIQLALPDCRYANADQRRKNQRHFPSVPKETETLFAVVV